MGLLALDTYSILFDLCLGEERSFFEFEAVPFLENHPGKTFSFYLYGM